VSTRIYLCSSEILTTHGALVVSNDLNRCIETIIGDMAIAVHPEDPRYGKYVGKSVHHPIRLVSIPVIADSKVDRDFGTGIRIIIL